MVHHTARCVELQHFGLVRYRWSNQLLTRHEVLTVEVPRWLAGADPSRVASFLRASGRPGPFVLRPGDDLCWRFTRDRQHLSLDVEMAWVQVRGDRPDIVIHEFSERWLSVEPLTFWDGDKP